MSRTVLVNANLLDGTNPVSAGATVVIDGKTIAAVRARSSHPASGCPRS